MTKGEKPKPKKSENDRPREGGKPKSEGREHYHLSDYSFDKDYQKVSDRFRDWLDEHGFDRPSSLKEEYGRIVDKWAMEQGKYDFDEKLKPFSKEKYSVLDRETPYRSFLTDRTTFETPEYVRLMAYAHDRDFVVTAGKESGHNAGSLHQKGLAVDVSVKGKTGAQIKRFEANAKMHGIRVRPELTHPPGQRIWTGPHIHLSVPESRTSEKNSGTRVRIDRFAPRTERESLGRRILNLLVPSAY